MPTKVNIKKPVNSKLYNLVAIKTNNSPKEVEECIEMVNSFVKTTIEKGAFETIMLPFFGKFKVKPRVLQEVNDVHVITKLI